jgi:hypothetical protein
MNHDLLRQVLLEVLEHSDQDDQPWSFYENQHPMSNWSRDDAVWERNGFVDAVVERLKEREAIE